jgi:hypothetical protein
MDKHLRYAITECCSPIYLGNHDASEAHPLVDAGRKGKAEERKINWPKRQRKIKIKK